MMTYFCNNHIIIYDDIYFYKNHVFIYDDIYFYKNHFDQHTQSDSDTLIERHTDRYREFSQQLIRFVQN